MGRFGGRFDERPGAEDTSADAKRDRVLAHFPPAMVPRAMALITPAQPGRDRCRFSFLADAATGRVALSFAESVSAPWSNETLFPVRGLAGSGRWAHEA